MAPHHFVVLSYPGQGHINPNIQLSKRLIRIGVRITFVTSSYSRLTLIAKPIQGLTFVEFNDGYDGLPKRGEEARKMFARMRLASYETIQHVVSAAADVGCPVTCITYSLLMPWVAAVARELHLPSAFLWVQAATMFDVYYYYNHGFEGVVVDLLDKDSNPSATFEFPGLPLAFKKRDLPAILFADHMTELDAESGSANVLVNTFNALEPEALASINESKIKLMAIGPLIPSAFLDCEDPSDTSYGGDLVQNNPSEFYIKWLDSKPNSSVVYVSFGTLFTVSKQQMEEIGRGLLDLGMPFLWVIRESGDEPKKEVENELMSCMEELEQLGLVVPWCSQLEVLSHPALSCFFTHCGWNSTIEGLTCGVPMVGFPGVFDQCTNAKLVEDYFEVGVRVNKNEDGLAERSEIKRCLELVIEDEKIRQKVKKIKELAIEAVKEGGSSDKNLKDFVNNIGC